MDYYSVAVRSSRYHGKEALTYASSSRLARGSVVRVELQKEMVLGMVTGPSGKPRFQTKPVTEVLDVPPLPAHLLKLATWLPTYYPAPLGIITQQFLPPSFSAKQLAAPVPAGFGKPDLDGLPPLTSEQKSARAAMTERDTYLVHGTTGSGKTRLYIEMAARAVAAGNSAIILTPEISLTSQLAGSFRQVFGERVIVMHSQQAPSERQKAWLDCVRAKEPVIVIGPRSALFSPIRKPGLIVLDEAHETAYKQEQSPQYETGRVAAYLAQLARATLILGSATPSISDYFLAEHKGKPIIPLTRLARKQEHGKPKITVVDRKDHSLFSRSPFLSLELIKAVESALAAGQQSLLYLNRRGTARLVLCENCGWQATCPHCDVPLTYHGDRHELRCHSCNYHAKSPSSCPECGHANVMFKTAGTKAIVDEVHRLFPGARAARFDTDNARAERFEQHYEAIERGDVDILVGTQLLAKGLDLPRLSTLGILLADTSLYMPDFSAEERTFQLISQVLGRVGRGHVAGRAIIQTYHPDHPVLAAALAGDYEGFYKTELASREQFLFPPFCYLLKLTVRRASIDSARTAAESLREEIETSGARVRVEGPAPSFYERFQNKYQWQLIIKARQRSELLNIIEELPSGWSYDIDPSDLL
ncbi:MAG TPA: primosomal protein N' [Candidatus Saccharimonadales bacterium]|nr:primosomal protein N' [Candidatus Saccharimonadales bacterium]